VRKTSRPGSGLKDVFTAIVADPVLLLPVVVVVVLSLTLGVIAWFRFG
jgi:hypothetical protein